MLEAKHQMQRSLKLEGINIAEHALLARDNFLRECLVRVCYILAPLSVAVMVVDLFLLGPEHPRALLGFGSLTLLIFLGIPYFIRHIQSDLRYTDPLAACMAGGIFINLLARECLTESEFTIPVLGMYTMLLSVFFISTRWLVVCLVIELTISAWVVSQVTSSASLHNYLILKLTAILFCLIVHIFRTQTLEKMCNLISDDVAKSKELEAESSARAANEEKFHHINESVPFGIFQVDEKGYCEYVNNNYRSVCLSSGVTQVEHRWVEILPAESRESTFQEWLIAAQNFDSFNGVYRQQLTSGEFRWLEILISPVFSDEGSVFVGTVEDITDKKLAHDSLRKSADDLQASKEELEKNSLRLQDVVEQLEAAKEKAEQSARSKSEFLANMSHEIRTPMTAILGYTDILLEQSTGNSSFQDYLFTIKRNGEHLLQVINDILDITKIEAGKMPVEILPTSPVQMIAEVYKLMSIRAQEKKLDLSYEFVGKLPELIQTDPTRLRQILINLISNAIKFTPQGEVRIKVQMRRLKDSYEVPALEISVIDNGIGMSEAQKEKLFQPFTQADTSMSRRFGGTGLGLVISQRLAQRLGGKIFVETELNHGSTFKLVLRTGDLSTTEWTNFSHLSQHHGVIKKNREAHFKKSTLVDHSTARPTAAAVNPNLKCRLLLAEDGLDNQKLISFLLKKAGAEVTIAENGKIAVEKILQAQQEKLPFDLILMDMQMPIQDGYSATRELRQRGLTLPIIALTAHAMTGDREKCLQAGCSDFATKPINRQKLFEVLRDHLAPLSDSLTEIPSAV